MHKLLGRRGKAGDEEAEGKVAGRINVKKISRYAHRVTAYLVERSTGETVYKVKYVTIEPEHHAYNVARDDMARYCRAEDFIMDEGAVTTNVEMPAVYTLRGKGGYSR